MSGEETSCFPDRAAASIAYHFPVSAIQIARETGNDTVSQQTVVETGQFLKSKRYIDSSVGKTSADHSSFIVITSPINEEVGAPGWALYSYSTAYSKN